MAPLVETGRQDNRLGGGAHLETAPKMSARGGVRGGATNLGAGHPGLSSAQHCPRCSGQAPPPASVSPGAAAAALKTLARVLTICDRLTQPG